MQGEVPPDPPYAVQPGQRYFAPSSWAEVAIKTRGLRKVYPQQTVAVEGIDLEVGSGEFFGLLGLNGAGKSTTVGMLTTRIVPTAGEMWVHGLNVRKATVAVRQIIGVVTQFNTLDRRLTAWENIFYHARYFGLPRRDAREQADSILDLLQLKEKKYAFVDELSGGMQQRLLIGRALAHRPEVLFLDEPTAGIDPQGRIAMWEMLEELHKAGLTILLTTHYMEEAERLCQRVAIIDKGRIVASGSPEELKSSLGGITLVSFVGQPVKSEFLARLRMIDVVRSVDLTPGGFEVQTDAPHSLLGPVLAAAQGSDVQITDISIRGPSLETVFLNLTGKSLRE